MNDKTKQALESAAALALEVLKKHRQMKGEYPMGMLGVRAVEEIEAAFREMDEQLAKQPAQDQGQSCYCPECERLSKELNAIKAQQPVACKTLCELCVKRGYHFCANAAQTTPIPSQPASKPLTGEQILSLVPGLYDCLCDPYDCDKSGDDYASIPKDMIRLARAIEAAHGIKGDA